MGSKARQRAEASREATRLFGEFEAFMDRLGRRDVPEDVAVRGRALAETIGEALEEASERASSAWRESRPARREVAKALERQGRDLGKWSRQMWRSEIRPGLRKAWSRRTAAMAAAGAAVPAGRQIIEEAAAELGIKTRQERHWGAFLAGIVIGAVTGAIVALMTAPKSGRETRDELTARARDAAEAAGEWIPITVPSGNGAATVGVPDVTEVESES